MKKLLVIGIKGMAGHVIYNYFKEKTDYNVFGVARNIMPAENEFSLDVSNTDLLRTIIHDNNFDYIINCIGILNKDAEDNPAKAIWFNSYFPHFLEEVTKNSVSKIIHISTDCVFSGKRGQYTEADVKDGEGVYAQSKALGEIDNTKDLTIRTSIIGPELNKEGIGLFHWFMMQPEDKTLMGYSKAYWSGLTTLELAEVIENALSQGIIGLIEVAPKEKIDKYNLLLLINAIYKNNIQKIQIYDGYVVDKSLVSIRSDFDYSVKSYNQMLENQKQWIENYSSLYQHYL